MPGDKQPFAPGVSHNPGGRPRTDPEVKALLKQRGPDAVRAILAIMDADGTTLDANRAYGKPVQAVEGTDDGPAIRVLFAPTIMIPPESAD